MKYYKSPKFLKAITSTGFVTIIAFALVAVGAIAWFALSKDNSVAETPSNNNSTQSYSQPDISYNDEVSIPDVSEPITDANESVNDVPYTQEESRAPIKEKISYILPIEGNISKGYSDTALQYSTTYNDMRLHTAVDILCKAGSNIKSVGNGTVKAVTDDANYGRIITIEYEDDITIKYCGMGSVNVKESDSVATGDVIGTSGEIPCECADNPHIHIEAIVDGKVVSPLAALDLE